MSASSAPAPPDDEADQALLAVVERFGLLMAESGMPRMASRVFAYVIAEDSERYTAGELATGLRVSPAAISGAVRYLVQVGLLVKGREPGARSDHYAIDDRDLWPTIFSHRMPLLERWADVAGASAAELPDGSAGAQRLRETQAFFMFMASEMHDTLARWRDRKHELLTTPEEQDGT